MKNKCNNPNTKRLETPTNPSSFFIRNSSSPYLLSCMCLINVLLSCNIRCRVVVLFFLYKMNYSWWITLVHRSGWDHQGPWDLSMQLHVTGCPCDSGYRNFFPNHNMRTLFNQEHISETALMLASFWLSLVHQTILLRGLFPVPANRWHFRRKPIFSVSQKKS